MRAPSRLSSRLGRRACVGVEPPLSETKKNGTSSHAGRKVAPQAAYMTERVPGQAQRNAILHIFSITTNRVELLLRRNQLRATRGRT